MSCVKAEGDITASPSKSISSAEKKKTRFTDENLREVGVHLSSFLLGGVFYRENMLFISLSFWVFSQRFLAGIFFWIIDK